MLHDRRSRVVAAVADAFLNWSGTRSLSLTLFHFLSLSLSLYVCACVSLVLASCIEFLMMAHLIKMMLLGPPPHFIGRSDQSWSSPVAVSIARRRYSVEMGSNILANG